MANTDKELNDAFLFEVDSVVNDKNTDPNIRKAVGIATVVTILDIVVTALKTLGDKCGATASSVAKASKNPTPSQQLAFKAHIRRAARQAKRSGKPGADADGVVDTAYVAAMRTAKKNPEAVARQYESMSGN
jgi:hypothetical protein